MEHMEKEERARETTQYTREEVNEFRSLFNSFDASNAGHLEIDELERLLEGVLPGPLTAKMRQELLDLLGESDVDDSESIDFGEFLLAMWKMQQINFLGINDTAASFVKDQRRRSSLAAAM